jgi:hypothetical protein
MQADQSLDAKRVQIEAFDAETARMKALAPKGVAFAPETQQAVEQVVMSTLMQLLNDPDMISGQGQQPPMQPTQPQPGPPLAA